MSDSSGVLVEVGKKWRPMLGAALAARATDVVAQIRERTIVAGGFTHDDSEVESVFDNAALVSTGAFAHWLSGSSTEEAREAGADAAQLFGELAAQRAAPLNEITKRCLRWRDVVQDVLTEEAGRIGCSEQELSVVRRMLARSGDVTIVRLCEAFEAERQHMHDEVMFRQAELSFQATHDALTGLANRSLVVDHAHQALQRARRSGSEVAVLLIDLDNFKYVNDTYGHTVGDRLLVGVVERFDDVARESDMLGRLGGDEFIVIVEGRDATKAASELAGRIRENLSQPIALHATGADPIVVTASIGISDVGDTAEALVRNADIAMYQAKRDGRDRSATYEPAMRSAIQRRLELERDLRSAVERQQFFLTYQPIVQLGDLVPVGFEALLRWAHPTQGTVPPDEFIPVLEDTGLIVPVGKWVLETALRDCAEWSRRGATPYVAVNVSARQLDRDAFADDVARSLDAAGVAASRLVIEITETAIMENADQAGERLDDLKAIGVRVAIDDFGTGYSSLDHLRRFPVDLLKIDRSFISRMLRDDQGDALVRTFVQLGAALGIETVAEGIENRKQLRRLREHDCNRGQGFLFAHPMLADEVMACLAADGPLPGRLAPLTPVT